MRAASRGLDSAGYDKCIALRNAFGIMQFAKGEGRCYRGHSPREERGLHEFRSREFMGIAGLMGLLK